MMCDNTEHEGKAEDIKPVKMREEFDGTTVEWCKGCRERDRDMIKQRV